MTATVPALAMGFAVLVASVTGLGLGLFFGYWLSMPDRFDADEARSQRDRRAVDMKAMVVSAHRIRDEADRVIKEYEEEYGS